MLHDAGYVMKGGKLVNLEDRAALSFEILSAAGSQPTLTDSLDRQSEAARASMRKHTPGRFGAIPGRLRHFDYEVVSFWVPQIGTPGAEQRARWGSKSADDPKAATTIMGIKNPAVDALIEDVVAAKDRG